MEIEAYEWLKLHTALLRNRYAFRERLTIMKHMHRDTLEHSNPPGQWSAKLCEKRWITEFAVWRFEASNPLYLDIPRLTAEEFKKPLRFGPRTPLPPRPKLRRSQRDSFEEWIYEYKSL